MYDLIIIGAGPAGLSAAIYASRARLNAIVIEQNYVNGGQIIDTYEIDNYPGLPGLSGMDLAMKMAEHAEKLGVETVNAFVQSLDLEGPVKKVITDEGTYEAKAVIIASGATHSKLGAQGENQYAGMGVSYCATCDGAFYRGKDVLVVGGGDVAVEDAIFLTSQLRTPSSWRAAAIKSTSCTAEMSSAQLKYCRRAFFPSPTWRWCGTPTSSPLPAA